MPAVKGETCFCHLCTSSEAGSRGRFIPGSQLKSHRKRIEDDLATRSAQLPSEDQAVPGTSGEDSVADLVAGIYAIALDSNADQHPSRCFTSRNEYQETQSSAAVPNAHPESIDVIMGGVERLNFEQSVDVRHSGIEKTPANASNDLDGGGYRPPSSSTKPSTKRERNVLTTRAHASLNHIGKHVKRLTAVLDVALPSLDAIVEAEKQLQTLRASLVAVKRQTETLNKKKEEIRTSFSILDARLLECRALFPPSTTPLQVNTGEQY